MSYTMEPVPTLSIAGMILALLVGVFVPVILLLVWKKKTGLRILPFTLGMATFVAFAMLLESLFHRLVLGLTGETITGNIWLYALYGGLAAGLFEETGRYLAMRFLMKKTLNRESAVAFGIGHGGMESVLVLGVSMVSNLSMTVMLTRSGLEPVLEAVPEELREAYYTQISALWTTDPSAFFLASLERLSALTLHICLSYLVYRAVKDRKIALFFAAIGIHAAIDFGVSALAGLNCPTAILEAILALMVAAFAFFTVRAYRREGEDPVLRDA